jgi:integrase/recombinase XerD
MAAQRRITRPDDPRFGRVLQVWRATGLKSNTMARNAAWLKWFLEDCRQRGRKPDASLTRRSVLRFVARRVGPRGGGKDGMLKVAPSALRAWSWGLAACGYPVPPWLPAPGPSRPLRPILRDFVEYRRHVCGIAASTTAVNLAVLHEFLRFLRKRGRSPVQVRLADVDAYVIALCHRFSPQTVQGVGSSIRAFLRFLHSSGRLRHDLASAVAVPLQRRDARPPRALPWEDVRRILRAVDRSTRYGIRDYALLLTMATYGLGAGEAFALLIEDIDWRRNTLRVMRPKTGQEVVLPLLGPVARALAAYLKQARPRHTSSRNVFVQMRAPFERCRCASAASNALKKHAHAAGISAPFLGSHALRHSHATRQVDLGAPMKVVGDVLGHLRPESTSVYVRVALRRLRYLALPVPS